jgi:phenylalanyl-tRNA synthetase beta chain
MKISLNWLRQFINLPDSPEEISSTLTDIGLEVEKTETVESVKGGLQGLVIGEIIETQKHPGADKLSLTKVNVGEAEPLTIVCGAPNVAEGQKVIVAPVNTTIHPISGDSFKIKKAKIRGEVSLGMICAEDEIGLGQAHDGIIVLGDDAQVGQRASEYYDIKNNVVFEIGLTPNRGDAASHFGVARDLAVSYNEEVSLPSVDAFKAPDTACPLTVEIEDGNDCYRYTGICINDITVGPSPDWLRELIESIGIGSINNVVDVTNYVLHSIGQPIHAFDLDKLTDKTIRVGKSVKGSKFTTLDEKERELNGEELMIYSGSTPIAMAGVFGGFNSGITPETKNIFIESACFGPHAVRKSAKLHGLNTDASFRYERGTDPEITEYALKRISNLITELAGGKITSGVVDVKSDYLSHNKVDLNLNTVNKIIGSDVPREEVERILNGLEIEILESKGDDLSVSVPAYRSDVLREIDLIEDILRFYGYNNVEIPSSVNIAFSTAKDDGIDITMNSVGGVLRGMGFSEMMSNSLSSSEYYTETETLVEITNPLSKELNVMRASMLPNTLEAISYNIKRKSADLKLFEWGKTYEKRNGKHIEKQKLIIACTGNLYSETWENENRKVNYYYMKSIATRALEAMGLDPKKILSSRNVTMGSVDKASLKVHGIKQAVFYAEIDCSILSKVKDFKPEALSKYPSMRRDLSLVLKKSVQFSEIEKIANKVDKNLIKRINIFDVYMGKPLGEDEKSYSVSFHMENMEKTLTDKEIDSLMNKLMQAYEKELNAVIRR